MTRRIRKGTTILFLLYHARSCVFFTGWSHAFGLSTCDQQAKVNSDLTAIVSTVDGMGIDRRGSDATM